MRFPEDVQFAIPYAGITQIRFKGYLLSQNRRPLLFDFFTPNAPRNQARFRHPADKAPEFYGFYNMLGKFAAVIGPALLGSVALLTGNIRYGIVSLLIRVVAGGWLPSRVDIGRGNGSPVRS